MSTAYFMGVLLVMIMMEFTDRKAMSRKTVSLGARMHIFAPVEGFRRIKADSYKVGKKWELRPIHIGRKHSKMRIKF